MRHSIPEATPGQDLDAYLIGRTLNREEICGIMQIVHVHSTPDEWAFLERYMAPDINSKSLKDSEL